MEGVLVSQTDGLSAWVIHSIRCPGGVLAGPDELNQVEAQKSVETQVHLRERGRRVLALSPPSTPQAVACHQTGRSHSPDSEVLLKIVSRQVNASSVLSTALLGIATAGFSYVSYL